jgi:hypothetical protein
MARKLEATYRRELMCQQNLLHGDWVDNRGDL